MESDGGLEAGAPVRRRRADAESNTRRLLDAARGLLRSQPDASLEEIAAAAGVSRATVYRHFGSRHALVEAAHKHARRQADANVADFLRPPGELAGGPTPLDVADVLNKVPPHLLGEQVVAEAQRLAGVTSVALYVVDIDGTRMLRVAGAEEFPAELEVPLAVGPEMPRDAERALRASLGATLPGSVVAPLYLRGRALGVLLAVDAPLEPLLALGRQAAAALALAASYTDFFDARRRRRETTAAAEMQQSLLPPRIARVSGGLLAGNVLPGYDIGGDWFDYVENRDGTWLGVADSMGRGTTAAALGGVALGAFRAKRMAGGTLDDAARAVHRTVADFAIPDAHVSGVLARWHGPTSTLRWIDCALQPPLLLDPAGSLVELSTEREAPFGHGPPDRPFTMQTRRIEAGEMVLFVSDGVLQRRSSGGTALGMEGVRTAIAAADPTPGSILRALEDAVVRCSDEPLDDDATVVVFAPSSRS